MWRLHSLPFVGFILLTFLALVKLTLSTPPAKNTVKFQPLGNSCASKAQWANGKFMTSDEQWKNFTQVQKWRMVRDIHTFCSSLPDEFIFGGGYKLHVWTTPTEPYDPHPEETHYEWREDYFIGGEDHQNTEMYAYGRERQYLCISAAIIGDNTWEWTRKACRAILETAMKRCDIGSPLLRNGGKVWNDWMIWRVESFNENTMPKGGPWSGNLCEKTAYDARKPPVMPEPYSAWLMNTEF
jgi:hypothetical protein